MDAAVDLRRYETAVASSIEGRRLDGLQVVVDCANGSASAVAPAVLEGLGADVSVLHADPDGRNINDGCGSTHPEALQAAVVEAGADVGLAFDGDADRVLAVDETGELVDGDQIIALCALDLRDRGELAHNTVVVTVMSNLGFHQAMAEHGIEVVETAGRRPLRARGAGRGRAVARGRAVRPHHLPSTGHHRRRSADRCAAAGPAEPVGSPAVGARRRRHDPAAPGAAQRRGPPSEPEHRGTGPRGHRRRCRHRGGRAGFTRDGSWCGPAGPSR